MLSVFPYMLSFSFFAPTILRIVAGGCIVYIANYIFNERSAIAQVPVPVITRMPISLVWIAAGVSLLTGIALIAGFLTQIAAIIGVVISLKHLVGRRFYPDLIPLSTSTYLLLLAVCLSLIVTGAGAFGFDLPL